ncbi:MULTISPECIES: hypothetical protein [Halobacterium]|uniref:DUF7344 domain-containing protein n=1 Tax=Halobacterium TaxID=2239 RepID=UPI00073F3488|nr:MULTISPECIES: hypothetical protein [Halobacterium]MCG1003740.1 hypothetical protein [Halobacterium noricense]
MLTERDVDEPLDRAEIHDVLSNDRRWRVLELLGDDEPRDLRSLANDIAAAESGESPAPRQARQSVYVTLHQNHLPKLDSLGIVQYDDTSKMVELDSRADEIDIYLEVVERSELSWTEYYLGVVVLGLVTALASYTSTPVLATLDPAAYSSGALLALLLSIGFQLHEQGSPWLDRLKRS